MTVSVTDDGAGVPEQERSLTREECDITQLSRGSGLGLWLAKWITEAYDGQLEFPETDRGVAVTLTFDAVA